MPFFRPSPRLHLTSLRSVAFCAGVSSAFVLSQSAIAQVGHLPTESPYEDYKSGQTLSASGGWLAIKRDPAKVAPDATGFVSLRYDIGVGGPAYLFARYTVAPSTRNVFDPTKPAKTRLVSTASATTSVVDVGLDIALTGQKTWHHLIPSLSGGLGIASDFAKADTGLYRFGTKFSFTYGLGLRYLLRSGYSIRFDATNYIWQYQYPEKYFLKAADSTAILSDTKARSVWRGNWGVSAGVSVPIFR